jgi:hypothetical protein
MTLIPDSHGCLPIPDAGNVPLAGPANIARRSHPRSKRRSHAVRLSVCDCTYP